MSGLNLGGYDVVVHLAESVINRGLELLPNGSTFPIQERRNITLTALSVPLPVAGSRNVPLIYDAFLELERPRVVLNQAAGTVTISCDLSPSSQLTFLRPTVAADAVLLTGIVPQIALGGSVQLNCPFGVADISAVWGGQAVSGASAIAQAAGVAATVSLVVPSADGGGNVLLASAVNGTLPIQVSTADIQAALQAAGITGPNIGNAIGNLPLTTPVRLNAGPTPVQTVREVRARISRPGTPAAISLGVLTAIAPPSPGGTIPDPPASLAGAGAVILVLNYWTVHLIGTAMNLAHPGMAFSFNPSPPSADFSGAVIVEGGQEPITIRSLSITVNPNGGLHVHGDATASGSCWDADIVLDFDFTFTCDSSNGTVIPAASVPVVDVDVDKDCLCVIIGAIVGAVVGAIGGAVIGTIFGGPGWGTLIGGVVGAIGGALAANYLIDPLDLDGVSLDSISVLGGLTLPLPVGGAGILVQLCDFDDLAVFGDLVYVDLAERHRSGTIQLNTGTGFDLDSGLVRPNLLGVTDDIADLVWTGSALQTLPGAALGPVFSDSSTFGTLSLTDLEGFSYATGSIGFGFSIGGIVAGKIPVALPRKLVFDPDVFGGAFEVDRGTRPSAVSFALRTDEGRYAKCLARRNFSGGLIFDYVVYARPRPCISSLLTLETLSSTVIESGTETCAEVRTERPNLFGSIIKDVVLQPITTDVHVFDRSTERRIADGILPDNLDIFPLRPPRRPPRAPCGKHTTIEHKEAEWKVVDRKQSAMLQALPTGLAAPLTYRWTVFGTELPEGNGTVGVGPITIEYDQNRPILVLLADEGEDLFGSITINATDADGRKARATRQINSLSRIRIGGCCPKEPVKLTPIDAIALLERAKVAQRIYEGGVIRMRQLADVGRLQLAETTSLKSAVDDLQKKPARHSAKGRRH